MTASQNHWFCKGFLKSFCNITCVVYKGVGGWEGGGEGGGGRAGGSSIPETKAAQPSGQELTETATVGPQHDKGRGGRRGPIGTSMPPY